MIYLRSEVVCYLLFFLFAFYFSPIAFSGQIVVRKSSEPFDAFAVRDEVLREYEWKEALRMQQQIDILQSLPLNCIPFRSPYHYYHCNGLFTDLIYMKIKSCTFRLTRLMELLHWWIKLIRLLLIWFFWPYKVDLSHGYKLHGERCQHPYSILSVYISASLDAIRNHDSYALCW